MILPGVHFCPLCSLLISCLLPFIRMEGMPGFFFVVNLVLASPADSVRRLAVD